MIINAHSVTQEEKQNRYLTDEELDVVLSLQVCAKVVPSPPSDAPPGLMVAPLLSC